MIISIVSQHTPTHRAAPLAYALTHAALSVLLVFGTQSAHAVTPLSLTNPSQGAGLKADPDAAKIPVQMMSRPARVRLEERITRELQRSADSKQWFESQTRRIKVDAKFDLRTGRLIVDLGEEYGPHSTSAEMEDLQKWLENSVWLMLEDATPYLGTDFLYGGKDMYQYFPEEWRPPRPASTKKISDIEALNAPIVVSGGHGIYYNYQYKDWRAQRDPSNGITEDFVTPSYAAELRTWLTQRSSSTVLLPRSTATQPHDSSAMPWWKIGARYHIETPYPSHPEIWHSIADDTSSLRERTEDIYSRPLFANHVGANAVFHLHTNAADPSATGTRVFHQKGRAEDSKLGDSILCSMKELIRAQEHYKDYNVPSRSKEENYAENRLANMPSILVEIGFHTNPGDAAALQDPVFRTAAMKGVEKGYRLFSEGKLCEPFKITDITDSVGSSGSPAPIVVNFRGFPQFAVTKKLEFADCPPDATCTGSEVVIAEPVDSPLTDGINCDVAETVSARLRTTLTDIDGVTTSAEHEVTCRPSGASMRSKARNTISVL